MERKPQIRPGGDGGTLMPDPKAEALGADQTARENIATFIIGFGEGQLVRGGDVGPQLACKDARRSPTNIIVRNQEALLTGCSPRMKSSSHKPLMVTCRWIWNGVGRCKGSRRVRGGRRFWGRAGKVGLVFAGLITRLIMCE